MTEIQNSYWCIWILNFEVGSIFGIRASDFPFQVERVMLIAIRKEIDFFVPSPGMERRGRSKTKAPHLRVMMYRSSG